MYKFAYFEGWETNKDVTRQVKLGFKHPKNKKESENL